MGGQGGTPGTPPPSRPGGGVPQVPPYPDLRWGTPYPDLRWDTPLPRPEMGYPLPRPEMGYTPYPDLRWGTPHLDLGRGTPLPRPEMGYPPPRPLLPASVDRLKILPFPILRMHAVIKGNLVNFIFEAKACKVICTTFQVGYFSLYSLSRSWLTKLTHQINKAAKVLATCLSNGEDQSLLKMFFF